MPVKLPKFLGFKVVAMRHVQIISPKPHLANDFYFDEWNNPYFLLTLTAIWTLQTTVARIRDTYRQKPAGANKLLQCWLLGTSKIFRGPMLIWKT